MGYLTGLRCLRCERMYPAQQFFQGCEYCTGERCSNLQTVYDYQAIARNFSRDDLAGRPQTMWRYYEFLPVNPENIVTIGEGMTPLIHCRRLGRELGLERLYVKEESRNPTWSFKDRLASAAISKAVEFGAPVITTSSSGNGGAATAAYSAQAGLPCVIFTTTQFPANMLSLMQVYGAMLVTVPTMQDRWHLVKRYVDECGWYPVQNFLVPPIGANPYGIDGYKTIAYETCEQLDWQAPDVFVVPVASGDAFVGPWHGFSEFFDLGYVQTRPRMIAAEVFGPLQQALRRGLDHVEQVPGGKTVAVSTGATNSAYQSLRTVRDSGGSAVVAGDEEIMEMQTLLARTEGIYAEASSVLTLAVIKKMRECHEIDRNETVVALLTSSGLKDPEVTLPYVPSIPAIQPHPESLERALRETYQFTIPPAPTSTQNI